jgi:NADPH:quinone reductase-like Zn-dependent oxidoreductase
MVSRARGTTLDQVLAQVAKLVEAGKYDVHIDATLPLKEVTKAWEMSRSGHVRGKIVLTVP